MTDTALDKKLWTNWKEGVIENKLQHAESKVNSELEHDTELAKIDTTVVNQKEQLQWDIVTHTEQQNLNQVKAEVVQQEPNFFEKLWSKPYDVLGINSVSETIKTVTGVVMWAGVVGAWVWWIKKIYDSFFWEKEDEKEKKEANWWTDNIRSFLKKVALWWWWAMATSYLASYFLKWKKLSDLVTEFQEFLWFKKKEEGKSPDTDSWSSDAIDDSEDALQKEKPQVQQTYTAIGNAVNTMQTTAGVQGSKLWGEVAQKLDQHVGAIPYMLDGRYKTLWDLVGAWGLFNEWMSKNRGELLHNITSLFQDSAVSLLQWMVQWIVTPLTMIWLMKETTVAWFFDKLKSDPNYATIITYMFDKTLMTISYLQNRKDAYIAQLKKEGKSDKDIEQIIQSEFLSKRMCEFDEQGNLTGWFIHTLQQRKLIDVTKEQIDPEILKKVEQSDEEKAGNLSKLDDLDKKLDAKTLKKEDVEWYCDDMIEELDFFKQEGLEYSILPVKALVDWSDDTMKMLYNNSALKLFSDSFLSQLLSIKQKWSWINKEDIKKLKEMTEDFYELKQQLYLSHREIQESIDAEWNTKKKFLLKWSQRLVWAVDYFVNLPFTGYELTFKKDGTLFDKGLGICYLWWSWYLWFKLMKYVWKKWLTPKVLPLALKDIIFADPLKVWIWWGNRLWWNFRKTLLKTKIWTKWLEKFYKTESNQKLFIDFLEWNIDEKWLINMANRLQLWWVSNFNTPNKVVEQFIKKSEFKEIIKDIHGNDSIRVIPVDEMASRIVNESKFIQDNKYLRKELRESSLSLQEKVRIFTSWDLKRVTPNADQLVKGCKISEEIRLCPDNIMKQIRSGMMKGVKSIDDAEKMDKLIKELPLPNLLSHVSPTTKPINPEKMGKLIGEYTNVIKTGPELEHLIRLIDTGIGGTKKPTIELAEKILLNWSHYRTLPIDDALSQLRITYPKYFIEYTDEIDTLGKTLTGDSKKLFNKAMDEISALGREAEWAKWLLQRANRLRIAKETTELKSLTKKIATLWEPEAAQLFKATEKISLRTLSKFIGEMDDAKKLWPILEDLLKGSEKIDAPKIAAKLLAKWESKAAKFFEKETDLNKYIIKELAELHAQKIAVIWFEDGLKILAKLLGKLV